ncbi:MAG: serine hydrolase [Bacteroidota bacterium]
MKKIALLPLLFCSCLLLSQSDPLVKKLDSLTTFIDTIINMEPGTSVVITKENRRLFAASNGLSSIELKTENNINTMYDLASIAKMFTGYCIATLEHQGKLSMEDDIRKYLKDFPVYEHPITIQHLVHHTSGIKNWTYLIQEVSWASEDKISTDQLLRLIYAQKNLDFTPGERYKYCNSGYVLLTAIIEEVTQQSFVEWTNEHIFEPLKMDHTFFNDNQNRMIPGMASAYRLNSDDAIIREAYNTSALGSSSLISNAVDMEKWMNFLLYPPEDKKAIVELMLTTRPLNNGESNNYAYGIEIEDYNGQTIIGHSGSWASFTSQMTLIPDQKIGVFFANNYRVYTNPIMELYLDVLIPEEEASSLPEEEEEEAEADDETQEEVIVATAQLDKYLGLYKLKDAWYIEITRKGGDLYTRANGERAFYMKPLNDSTFLVRNYGNRTITFVADADGSVNQLIYNEMEAPKKTEPFYFDSEAFKKYEGVYYSTELDILYNIKVTDDKMYYSNIKTGRYEVICENDTLFFTEGRLSKLLFEQNSAGQIVGFYKINSRSEKLFYFKKANTL